MVSESEDLDYWRELANERQRQLDILRGRLLAAIDAVPEHHLRSFISALDITRPAWARELDFMTATTNLERDDVTTVLDDLWRRVAADHTP